MVLSNESFPTKPSFSHPPCPPTLSPCIPPILHGRFPHIPPADARHRPSPQRCGGCRCIKWADSRLCRAEYLHGECKHWMLDSGLGLHQKGARLALCRDKDFRIVSFDIETGIKTLRILVWRLKWRLDMDRNFNFDSHNLFIKNRI